MIRANGSSGGVWVGYHLAARLGAWSLVLSEHAVGDDVATLDASVVARDSFWSMQPPTIVRLQVGSETWVWRDVRAIAFDGARVRLTVAGPPQ